MYTVHTTHDFKWPVHQAVQYRWILDDFPYRKYYIVVLGVYNKVMLQCPYTMNQ